MPTSMDINLNVAEMEYAVRGPIPRRAAELARQGMQTIPCNIGNPQALGQRPITYYRQVLSLLEHPPWVTRERALRALVDRAGGGGPEGLDGGEVASEHVLQLCEAMLRELGTGLGAYTESKGPLFIREAVARYIDARDGVQGGPTRADPEQIFLTNGASEAAKFLIDMMVTGPDDGIMIPIPQYPLYSAAIRRAGGVQVNYYPDEDGGWTLDRSILERAHVEAVGRGVCVKAIVVINPGNPTGAVLPADSGRELVEFAGEHGLAIIADEVYQDNLYGAEFVSFARLVGGQPIALFSLHSTSKGFYGECGHRGGYVEVRNPPATTNTSVPFVEALLKQASVSLCSNTVGQALTYLMATPPPAGSPDHARFVREREGILEELYRKATMIRAAFEQMEGVECFGRTGAMYLFPRLGKLPYGTTDFDYCMALLEQTGLTTVNGSGFGQAGGTHHLRIAFLPPRELLARVLPEWTAFHNNYVAGPAR